MPARGVFQFPDVPNQLLQSGLRTDFGMLTPPGGRVAAYVRSGGPMNGDSDLVKRKLLRSINEALPYCDPDHGDIVVVLPGHAETLSAADALSNLVAGTKIIGVGRGSKMPKITWGAAAATLLLDQVDCTLKGLRLNLSPDSGSVVVAAPITVSAAGCSIEDCEIRQSVDANSRAALPIATTAAGDDFLFRGNNMLGAVAGACTTGLRLVGADRARLVDNIIKVATSGVAVGAVQMLTTLSADIQMLRNVIGNTLANSTHALSGLDTCTGFIDDLLLLVNSGIAGANTVAGMHFGGNCKVTDGGGTYAVQFGTAST